MKRDTSNEHLARLRYKCQFCWLSTHVKDWTNNHQTCPICGKNYDYQLAQATGES
jgi:rubrerythrin